MKPSFEDRLSNRRATAQVRDRRSPDPRL